MQTKPLHLDVHEQIECAQTLASRFYTDPAILEIERTRIFQRSWQLVGTLSEFFDRSTMCMVPLRCETWEQFIFLNFDLKAEPLSTYFGQIPRQARGFQFEGLQFAERRDYVIDCNWKVYVDNYLEGYLIPIAHPGLMKEIDYARYRTDTYRYYSQQLAPIRAMKAEDAGDRLYAPATG